MARICVLSLFLGMVYSPQQAQAERDEEFVIDGDLEVSQGHLTLDAAEVCDVTTLTTNYGDELEKQLLEQHNCKCLDESFMIVNIEEEDDCTGTNERKKVCRWEDDKCSHKPQCEDLPYAESPQNCQEHGLLGCVSADPRPLALASSNTSNEPLLANPSQQVCYFNSAIITLFGGANSLVPYLTPNRRLSDCFLSVRKSLVRIVRAMRNLQSVNEDDYVRKMMQCIRASCANEANSDVVMALVPTGGDTYGEPIGVLREIFLPAMKLSHETHDMEYEECDGKGTLMNCVETKLQANATGWPHLHLVAFIQRAGTQFQDGLKFYESGGQITVKDMNYIMWAGTAATINHVVGWTLHPSHHSRDTNDKKLTVYDDMSMDSGISIREFDTVEDGFNRLNRDGLRVNMIIFKRNS